MCPLQAKEAAFLSAQGTPEEEGKKYLTRLFLPEKLSLQNYSNVSFSFIKESFIASHLNLKNPFKMQTSLKSKYVELFFLLYIFSVRNRVWPLDKKVKRIVAAFAFYELTLDDVSRNCINGMHFFGRDALELEMFLLTI